MNKDKKQEAPNPRDRVRHDLRKPDETPREPEQAEESCGLHDQNVPVYDFEFLAEGQRMVMIRLSGEVYTLRRTQAGKLLLNK